MKKWYLIQSKLKQEKTAQQNLENQNYTTYSPKAKIDNKIVQLFPRYLFVQLDESIDNFAPIRSTKGVSSFVRFGDKFAIVNDNIIIDIKTQESKTIDKIIDLSNFHKGDKILVKDGAFKGQNAIFQSYDGEKRVIVLLKIIGQQQQIELDEKVIKEY